MNENIQMNYNIFDCLVKGLDLEAFYSFIDKKTILMIMRQSWFFNILHGKTG